MSGDTTTPRTTTSPMTAQTATAPPPAVPPRSITSPWAVPSPAVPPSAAATLTPTRAARELGLKRGEFDLAVHLGRIATVRDDNGGVRVTCEEIDRLRTEEDFPDGLRGSVETVGTKAGAAIVGVPESRFTRLARLGFVVPVRFYLNRYRTVVWLYLATELRQFAAEPGNAPLLKGRAPESLRRQATTGADLRARNWRGRHLGFLLRRAGDDPWARAAALARLLDPVHMAETVKDPYERAFLIRLRPGLPVHGAPGSPAADLAEEITTASDPDEICWLRADLAQVLAEARHHRPAPRPTPKTPPPTLTAEQPRTRATTERPRARATAGHAPPASAPRATTAPGRRRGLRGFGWLRRRGPLPTAP